MFDTHSTPTPGVVDSIMAAADTTTPTITKILYDRKSAAFALSISTRSLDYLIGNKALNTVRLGSKVMVTHAELVKFSKKNHAALCSVEEAD